MLAFFSSLCYFPQSQVSLPGIYLQVTCLYQILVLWSASRRTQIEDIEDKYGVFGDGDENLDPYWLSNL